MKQKEMKERVRKEFKFVHALIPIASLLAIIVFGLVVQPNWVTPDQSMPLELIFLLALTISISVLHYLGYTWPEIQDAMVSKVREGLAVCLILLMVGLLIGSWVVAGTIPMLIFYGVKVVIPSAMYLASFIVPSIFALVTGTSWGSVGTIGVVLFGIGELIGANPALMAGAIVGGAYFGDKMSPLSDTTTVAAAATGVDIYEHIRSMVNTTGISYILAGIGYFLLGFVYPPTIGDSVTSPEITATLTALTSIFNFNIFLLIPPAIVLYGAFTKRPTLPTLVASSLMAACISAIFQRFTIADIANSLIYGFKADMILWLDDIPRNVVTLVNRGGLYQLSGPFIICILVFSLLGTLEITRSLQIVVERISRFFQTRSQTILAALFSTTLTNAMTSNQQATSFIISGAYTEPFKKMRIPQKVLSRSIEDGGTMVENIIPWTSTGVFMASTLGVPVIQYAPWQLLVWINYVVAIVLAITGIGCFYHEVDSAEEVPLEAPEAA